MHCPVRLISKTGVGGERRRPPPHTLQRNAKGNAVSRSSDIEQRERRELLGSTTTQTYFSRATADLALEDQGRFAKGVEVTGSKPAVPYPRQPPASPWSGDIPEGVEPPLGYAINDQEPTGEPFEIVASSVLSPDGVATAAPEEGGHSASARPAPSALRPLAADGATPAGLLRGRKL
jgi:hypothetical protein